MNDHNNIERYLQGEMSEEEMEDLEVRCLQDPSFRKEFQTIEVLIKGIKASARDSSLEDKLHTLSNWSGQKESAEVTIGMVGSKPRSSKAKWHLPLAIAASFLLLLFFTQILPGLTQPSSEKIFAQYYEVSPNRGPNVVRGGDTSLEALEAYQAYSAKNYRRASILFEEVIDDSPYRLTHLYHLGNCYLELGEWNRAISTLELVAYSNVSLSEDAKWYLAFAYLRSGDINKARELFGEISLPQERVKKAGEIYQALE